MNALRSLLRQARTVASTTSSSNGGRRALGANNQDVSSPDNKQMLGSGGHFRSSVWDPYLLISQIFAVQGIFYVSLCVWIFLADWWTGSAKSLDQVLRYENFYLRDSGGTKLYLAYLLNAISWSFPITLSWWLLQIVCVAITTVLGEYLCLQTELKAIPVTLGPKSDV